jgi:hypothetical protein
MGLDYGKSKCYEFRITHNNNQVMGVTLVIVSLVRGSAARTVIDLGWEFASKKKRKKNRNNVCQVNQKSNDLSQAEAIARRTGRPVSVVDKLEQGTLYILLYRWYQKRRLCCYSHPSTRHPINRGFFDGRPGLNKNRKNCRSSSRV